MATLLFYISVILLTTLMAALYERSEIRWQKILFGILTVLIPAATAGLRVGIGTDYGIYKGVYDVLQAGEPLVQRIEPGFRLFYSLWLFLGLSYQSLQFLFSLLTCGLYFYSLILLKKRVSVTAGMFAWMCMYYFMSWNYIRQLLACSFIMLACALLINRKKRASYILVIAAASIHITSLIVAPFFLFPNFFIKKKYDRSRLILYLVMVIVIFTYPYFLTPLLNWLGTQSPKLQYFINYLQPEIKPLGLGLLRYPVLFLIPCGLLYKKMPSTIRWLYNMCTVGFIIWLSSYVTAREFDRLAYSLMIGIPALIGYSLQKDRLAVQLTGWLPVHKPAFTNYLQTGLIICFAGALLFFTWFDLFYQGAHEVVPYVSVFLNLQG